MEGLGVDEGLNEAIEITTETERELRDAAERLRDVAKRGGDAAELAEAIGLQAGEIGRRILEKAPEAAERLKRALREAGLEL